MAATHSFSVETAAQEGLIEAIILQHIYFLQTSFLERGQRVEDVWVKRSVRALHITYPYLTHKQIRGAMDRMEERDLIRSKIESGYDRTKSLQVTKKGWLYFDTNIESNAFDKKANGSDEKANGFTQKGESLIGSCNSVSNSFITTTKEKVDVVVFNPEVNALIVESLEFKADAFPPTPIAPPPAPRRFEAFDIDKEERMFLGAEDAMERYARETGTPREKMYFGFQDAVKAFTADQKTTGYNYNNAIDYRKHFFNLVRRKAEIARNGQRPAPGASAQQNRTAPSALPLSLQTMIGK